MAVQQDLLILQVQVEQVVLLIYGAVEAPWKIKPICLLLLTRLLLPIH